jgi:HEAT repeat protein
MRLEKLYERLESQNPKDRIKALIEMAKEKDSESLVRIYKLAESEEDDRVRSQIAICLGQIANPNSGPVLMKLSHDSDITVKMEAVTALGILGGRGFTEAKDRLEKLINDENFTVKKYSIKALGSCGDMVTIEKLNEIYDKDDTSVELKSYIAQSIGEIGGSRAMELLNSWAIRGLMEVRREAIRALGTIADDVAVDLLVHIMNEKREDKIIRKYAKAALINIVVVAKEKYEKLKRRIESYL